ncbi:helix-turn-helix transcriptional regulator [Streptomyces abyssomicinicus]|uniref:helix-turn-helix transcriptional regulator n=1 Tax=Streptomyces abyssomicinicus TaxID=574929 RepID=UPI001581809F|nr:helix-turn-helix transcriptional regulator [Streptomyces abyssomicinicus]
MLRRVETRNVSPVFVGRTEELRVLGEALGRADAAEPQALLLGGEAGVGKTRLVEEFAAAATRRGAVVAVGGCVEIGADGLPFAPVSTALRVLRRELPEELAAAAAGQEDELARLLPELGDAVPGRHDDEGMARLFELIARLLEDLSAARTVVLVIEDLHWADTSTRHLLAYLLRTLRTGRLLVLATYRSDDVHRRHPLRPLLAELDRLRTVRRVELARFSRDEVARQLTGIQGAAPASDRVDDIYRRSDGNAFFVEELACSDSAESLHDLLLVRVERLPDEAQRVVRILAEAGSSVEHRLLAAVVELPEDRLDEALRAAVGANLLLAEVEGNCYRFRHSLVREAVADDLLPGERARINRRLAEALEADPTLVAPDRRVTRLAGYWYCAHDAAKALPAVLEAALEASCRRAYAEQLQLLERALELWDIAPPEVRGGLREAEFEDMLLLGPGERSEGFDYIDLLSQAAIAGRLCGERDRALKLARRALKLLDENRDPLRAAWFWNQKSLLVQALARGDGRAELDKARELTRGLPPSEVRAWVLAHSAAWAMVRHQGPEAIASAEHAVEYARMLGALPAELNARATLGCLRFHSGDVAGGLRELYAVKEEAIAAGLADQAARVYVNLPSELESVGRYREAVAMLEEGAAFTKRNGLVVSRAWVHANLAEALYSVGDWDDALRADEKTQRIGHAAKPQGIGRLISALVALHRGEVEEASGLLEEARELFGTSDRLPQESLPMARTRLLLASAHGRTDEARAVLLAALDAGLPPGAVVYSWPLLLAGAEAEIAAGTADEAVLERLRTEGRRQVTPAPVWWAHELWLRASLRRAAGGGDAGAEVDDWSAAVTAFETLERPYDLARIRLRLAESLVARGGDGDLERAAELLVLVGAAARRLGARPLAEAAEALLPSRPALAPGDGYGLTARERDVLPLVAAGRSNRQIADALHISPKTASVHVSNILAKLGVATRGEAAALAHRRGLAGSGDRA